MSNDHKKIFSENLKKYLVLSNKTQKDLIDNLKFDKSAVSTWCNGTKMPRMDKVQVLANYFGIEISDLIENASERGKFNELNYVKKIPLRGTVPGGRFMSGHGDDHINVTNPDLDSYMIVDDNSMINARIAKGDCVLIDEKRTPENGDIVIAVVKETELTTMGRFSVVEDKIALLKANDTQSITYYEKNEIDIKGIVLQVLFTI